MSRRASAVVLAVWVVLLYGSLAWLRPASEALRARGLLSEAVTLLLVLSALLALVFLRRASDEEPLSRPALLLAVLAGGWLATWWNLPEERVHLAQYVPVGVLAWRALGSRVAPALLLGALLGLGDELLQGVLPERTFDPWDVLANGLAVAGGVFVAAGGRLIWAAPALWLGARLLLPLLHPGHPGVPEPPVDPLDRPSPAPEPAAELLSELPTTRPESSAPYSGRSVLFVTVDALRADHVPPWGEAPVPTPAFDRLSRESVTFESVLAASIWTTPSMVSFFSSLPAAVHGVGGRGLELAPDLRTPLEALGQAGWKTHGFAGEGTETYRNLGFSRELDREAAPEDVVVRILRSESPAFVWMHLRSIHAPYDAPAERLAELGLPDRLPDAPILNRARSHYTVPRKDFPGRHDWLMEPIRALYAAELVEADAVLGRILDAVSEAGLDEQLLVVVSADHGEELLDHDGIGHASTTLDSAPHPELVHIPLYLRLPDGRGAGRQVQGRFEQTDLMTTLLPLLGVEVPELAPGVPAWGRDWSAAVLSQAAAPADRPLLVTGSPCGWQCPVADRDKRIHALVDGTSWTFCREGAGVCDPELQGQLQSARRLRARLETPVASPR